MAPRCRTVPDREVEGSIPAAARDDPGAAGAVIIALCGWKALSVFDRCRIVNEADLADGLGKVAAVQEAPADSATGTGSAFWKIAR